jgi:uroporphyrinogen decarboxylase
MLGSVYFLIPASFSFVFSYNQANQSLQENKMKPRDRVAMALSHQTPDRCPMQISFTPEFADRLKKDIHMEADHLHNPHGGGNTYELERAIGEDMLLTSVGWANSYYREGDTYIDDWGVGWKSIEYETRFGKGRYTEMCDHPLADDAAIASYKAPDVNDAEFYKEAGWLLDTLKDDYWTVGVTVTTMFETAWALRGFSQVLEDFALKPDLVEALFDIPYNFHLTAAKKLTQMGVDMIWIADDVGAQDQMLISPRMWRKFFKQRYENFIAEIKCINPNLKVAFHTDGNILPIVPDMIEIGVDVLNPIQPACMNPAELKKKYGQNLCFWGTVDEQHTLPFGNPQDVENEIRTRISTAGMHGGLIIGPTHHVQLDTPMENFWAMVNTIKNSPCQ